MRFSEEYNKQQYSITGYNNEAIRVNEKSFNTGFIISPEKVVEDWQPSSYQDFRVDHLPVLFDLNPDIILLGTGVKQIFPPKSLYLALVNAKIGFEIMNTQAACRTYNILLSEDRKVVAALFIR
ncbi:MAG: Mth938-like domain-containing protein [Cocleimonas sp.]|nr:Mth938-like domain-containing protein [Cocleimonas sp.]